MIESPFVFVGGEVSGTVYLNGFLFNTFVVVAKSYC